MKSKNWCKKWVSTVCPCLRLEDSWEESQVRGRLKWYVQTIQRLHTDKQCKSGHLQSEVPTVTNKDGDIKTKINELALMG